MINIQSQSALKLMMLKVTPQQSTKVKLYTQQMTARKRLKTARTPLHVF